ncbi:DUF1378 family protein [Candidatus Erwinia dacicola]
MRRERRFIFAKSFQELQMTLVQTVLLYGCTAVCGLYLISGGYKTIRAYIRKKLTRLLKQRMLLSNPRR